MLLGCSNSVAGGLCSPALAAGAMLQLLHDKKELQQHRALLWYHHYTEKLLTPPGTGKGSKYILKSSSAYLFHMDVVLVSCHNKLE